jgi:beta-phosphoglucomutase-like phosphatase (HAD superfamily)
VPTLHSLLRPDPSSLDLTEVSALLCDADGNLFPSEEPAFEASVTVTNRFLARLGSSGLYTSDELRQASLGRNFRAFATDLAREHGVSMSRDELDRWVDDEAAAVTRHLVDVLEPDQVVGNAVRALAARFRLAVVSSSTLPRLAACFAATGLEELFPKAHRFSAQDSLPEPTSKPDPGVYVHALREFGVGANQALAVEDAVAGVASAVAAGIRTVGNLAFVRPSERPTRAVMLLDAGACAVALDWSQLTRLLTPPTEEQSA